MIQLLRMKISLTFINYYISNLYILPVALQFVFVFVVNCSWCSKRHTCFRGRKARGRNEGEPTITSFPANNNFQTCAVSKLFVVAQPEKGFSSLE